MLRILLLPIGLIFAAKWSPEGFPNPRKDPVRCNPRGAGNDSLQWVCDPDALLGEKDILHLDGLSAEISASTPCACPEQHHCRDFGAQGFALAVVVIRGLGLADGTSEEEKNAAAKRFAAKLRDGWRLGQCSDDVIVFLAVQDKKSNDDTLTETWFPVVTSLGHTTERRVSVSALSALHTASHAFFSANRTAEGLAFLVQGFRALLKEDGSRGFGGPLPVWAIVLLCLLTLFLIAGSAAGGLTEFRRSRRRRRQPKRRNNSAALTSNGKHSRRNRERQADKLVAELKPVRVFDERSQSSSESDDSEHLTGKKPQVRIA